MLDHAHAHAHAHAPYCRFVKLCISTSGKVGNITIPVGKGQAYYSGKYKVLVANNCLFVSYLTLFNFSSSGREAFTWRWRLRATESLPTLSKASALRSSRPDLSSSGWGEQGVVSHRVAAGRVWVI